MKGETLLKIDPFAARPTFREMSDEYIRSGSLLRRMADHLDELFAELRGEA